jgi:hypothetical protein
MPAPWHYPPLQLHLMSAGEVGTLVKGRPTFDHELTLARQYHAWAWNSRQSVITCDLADETTDRLEQLNFLLKSAYALLPEAFARPNNRDIEGLKRQHQACFLLELYTEAFYYFAHRLQSLLEDEDNCLPHIDGYLSVKEVQVVRNQLLEHPEGASSGVTERRWSFRSNVGPVIKAGRRPDQPTHHQDPGLFATAGKLRQAIGEVLQTALAEIGKMPATYPPFVEHRTLDA